MNNLSKRCFRCEHKKHSIIAAIAITTAIVGGIIAVFVYLKRKADDISNKLDFDSDLYYDDDDYFDASDALREDEKEAYEKAEAHSDSTFDNANTDAYSYDEPEKEE